MLTAEQILNGTDTEDEKIRRLANLFLDAREWRVEESILLERFSKELAQIRRRVEELQREKAS